MPKQPPASDDPRDRAAYAMYTILASAPADLRDEVLLTFLGNVLTESADPKAAWLAIRKLVDGGIDRLADLARAARQDIPAAARPN